ncbi:MAG: PAS domain-containing protein [Prevotella sp.]|nr:PAS domain-containing protein [Prevotella sp.]
MMTINLLLTSPLNSLSVLWIWIAGGLVMLFLVFNIFRLWKKGKTLRQELEEIDRIKHNNVEYEFVLKAMKIAIWRWDSKSNTFSYENDFREGISSYVPDDDETYQQTLTCIAPADVDHVNHAFSDIVEGRTDTYHQEYQVLNRRSGSSYWEESYATVVDRDADGKPTQIVGTSMRVDDRKDLEASLIQARNKAEESDRLKTAFLANMGHEIRTPLNAIVGFADLLPVVQSEEDRAQLITEIQNNNRKLLRIIDGLVSMSKIEAGAKSLLMAKIDLNQVLQQMVETYQPTTNIQMVAECPRERLEVKSDRDKLLEVLDNLVQNAVKFTTEGCITLSYEVEAEQVRVMVSDTGKGIAEEDQERIFERFVKVDEYIPGTGLGLSVVKSHVENLGGQVGVQSALGAGSVFWFTLPLE